MYLWIVLTATVAIGVGLTLWIKPWINEYDEIDD